MCIHRRDKDVGYCCHDQFLAFIVHLSEQGSAINEICMEKVVGCCRCGFVLFIVGAVNARQ